MYAVLPKDERGLQRVTLTTRQIEALFQPSIHHPPCRFPDSSRADSRAPSLLLSISPALIELGTGRDIAPRETPPALAARGLSLQQPQVRPQKCRSDALAHRVLWDGRHFFEGTEASLHLLLKGHGQNHRGVLLLALQMLGDLIVSVFIPAAFIFIWIISLLVSQHHASSPFLQAFRQAAEHMRGRAQPVSAKNTKITQYVYTYWSIHI